MRLALSLLALAIPALAHAQTVAPGAPVKDVNFLLGGGPMVKPDYEGSNDYMLAPFPVLGLKFKVNPITGAPSSETGFGIRPALRVIGERSGSSNHDLDGMDTVKAAYEPGLNLNWTTQTWSAFIEARQGFGGHHGQLVDLGADAIIRPFDRLKISAGPRLGLASKSYMATYYDVSATEAVATGFAQHSARAGIRSYGVAARADYDLTPDWLIRAEATYNRLGSDAAASGVVKTAGSPDQFTLGIGAAYRFGFNYR